MPVEKKQIITIAGKPGSGKSTAAKGVAGRIEFEHFSSGDLFREIGKKHGMDVLETNLDAENNKSIDTIVDEKLQDLGKTNDKMVIDSRMAWHWMPYSFRVFLELDVKIAAKRILDQLSPERISAENIPNDIDEYAEILEERLESEARRYNKLYEVNPYDTKNYDLVVDTNTNNIDEVIDIITNSFSEWWRIQSNQKN